MGAPGGAPRIGARVIEGFLLCQSSQWGRGETIRPLDRHVASCQSTSVAQEPGMTNRGIVPVEVKPTTVPQPNGEMKLGAGAADLSPQQIRVTRVTASR